MGEVPQNMDALTYGNQVRYHRAEVHKTVRGLPFAEGRAVVADVLEGNAPEWRTMRAFDLIRWPKRRKSPIAEGWMRTAGVSAEQTEFRLVGEMTDRQRHVLAECLRGNGARFSADREMFGWWLANEAGRAT